MTLETYQSYQPVELILPANSRHLRLARLVVSGVAATRTPARRVEDVRIVLGEVCAALLEVGQGGPLRFTFHVDDETLVVQGTTASDRAELIDDERFAFSRRLLDVLSDSHRFDHAGGRAVFTVIMDLRDRGDG